VVVPFSALKETPKVSPRLALSALTEPESFGQPEPENTSWVMCGWEGGAARVRAGRAVEKMSDDRIVGKPGFVVSGSKVNGFRRRY
jgi:hypothetical protein